MLLFFDLNIWNKKIIVKLKTKILTYTIFSLSILKFNINTTLKYTINYNHTYTSTIWLINSIIIQQQSNHKLFQPNQNKIFEIKEKLTRNWVASKKTIVVENENFYVK